MATASRDRRPRHKDHSQVTRIAPSLAILQAGGCARVHVRKLQPFKNKLSHGRIVPERVPESSQTEVYCFIDIFKSLSPLYPIIHSNIRSNADAIQRLL